MDAFGLKRLTLKRVVSQREGNSRQQAGTSAAGRKSLYPDEGSSGTV